MKITYREILDNVPPLEVFAREKTPWKVGLALGKNLLTLRNEWQLVEQARAALTREFITTDKDGIEKIVDQEGFSNAYKEFFAKTFEFEPSTLEISEFEKLKEITGAAVAALLGLGITKEE